MCSLDVKVMLFRTYCTPMYCAQLWCRFRPSSNRRGALSKLYVAYHSILKLLIGVSKYERNSPIFVHLNVPTCAAVIRNLIYKFKCRVDQSNNPILQFLTSRKWGSSCLRSKWRELIYVAPQTIEFLSILFHCNQEAFFLSFAVKLNCKMFDILYFLFTCFIIYKPIFYCIYTVNCV